MIDQSTVQKVIDIADVVEVVKDFVTLKRSGTNYKGLCPFHNEKTPSFMVSPAKGIFKCFGCGESGNAVGFVMKHEHFSFPNSIKYLAEKYNIQIEEKEETPEEKEKRAERESLLIVSGYAQKYFTDILINNEMGRAIGLSYFKERGYSNEIIEKFQLGYCPDKFSAFTDSALKKGYKLKFLRDTGLTIVKEDKRFDRFYGRVIFPIHSLIGKVIGFGGRTLKADKKTAKYLNSPESDIYHKGRILYGLFFAKKTIAKEDKCYIVEGYTDVLSFQQAGIENVVASSGTALSEIQIRLIRRFSKNITFIFDGDKAGISAAMRGIDIVLKQEMNLRVIPLPENEDPDSFSKSMSNTDLKNYLTENEQDFITYKSKFLLSQTKNDPINRSKIISDIISSIAVIPNAIQRNLYIKETSNILNIEEKSLYEQINKIFYKQKSKNRYKTKPQVAPLKKTPELPSFIDEIKSKAIEKDIIYYILNFGNENYESSEQEDGRTIEKSIADFVITEIQNDDLQFSNLFYKRIFELYKESLLDYSKIDNNIFLNHTDTEISKLASELLSENYLPSKIWERKGSFVKSPELTYKKDVPKAIIVFKLKIILKAIDKNIDKIKEPPKNDNEYDKQISILENNQILENIKIQLADMLGRVIL